MREILEHSYHDNRNQECTCLQKGTQIFNQSLTAVTLLFDSRLILPIVVRLQKGKSTDAKYLRPKYGANGCGCIGVILIRQIDCMLMGMAMREGNTMSNESGHEVRL
jgi:hypothetical protein